MSESPAMEIVRRPRLLLQPHLPIGLPIPNDRHIARVASLGEWGFDRGPVLASFRWEPLVMHITIEQILLMGFRIIRWGRWAVGEQGYNAIIEVDVRYGPLGYLALFSPGRRGE